MPSSYIAQHFAFCSLQPLFFCSAEETSCQSTSLVIVGYRKEYLWQASLATAVNMCACLCSSSVLWSKAGSPALLPGCRSQREWRFNSYRPGTLFSGVLKRRVGGTLLPCSCTCLWLPDWGGLCGSQKFVICDSFLRRGGHCKTTIVDGYQVGLQQAIRSSIWGNVKTLFELYGFVNDSIWSSLKVCRNFNKYSEVHFNLDPLTSAVFIIKLFFEDSSLCFLWSGTDSSTIVCLLFFFLLVQATSSVVALLYLLGTVCRMAVVTSCEWLCDAPWRCLYVSVQPIRSKTILVGYEWHSFSERIYIYKCLYIYIYTYMRLHCSAWMAFHLVSLRVVKFLRSAAGTRSVTCVH